MMRSILLTVLVLNILMSCQPSGYLQIYKATPSSKLISNKDVLIYEDDNCKVSYNLWGEGGNIGFSLYNKTNDHIFINMDESFFILNGVAKNYYKDRIYTNSEEFQATNLKSSGFLRTGYESNSNNGGFEHSVSSHEERIVCIPSKASKIIKEYNINKSLFRHCDLYKYPKKSQIRVMKFSKDQSPIVFSNRITYRIGKSQDLIRFENDFFISEIANYPENELISAKNVDFCGQGDMILTNKAKAPDKFYVKYKSQGEFTKH